MMWLETFEAVRKVSEIIGIVLSGGEILSIRPRQLPLVLLQALWRGQKARDAISVTEILPSENKLGALQGVAFIVLGLVLQAAPYIRDLMTTVGHLVHRSL